MRSHYLHPLLLLLPILTSALTNKEKKLIVDKHNFYRTQTDPPATDMKTLSWDSTLEELATSYAAKCIWDHNEERGFRGENLFLMSGSHLDVDMGLADWFNEKNFYNFTTNTCQEGQMCGHYTQVVWAGTERVGCGEKFCETIQGFEDGNMYLLVCNYEPPGNFQGQKPYKPGAPCTACPQTYSCKGSLCVDTEQMESGTDGPGTASEVAPYTTELVPGLAADTTPGLAPDTTDGLAPDTTDGLAPDTTPSLASDTTPELAPDTTDGLAPDTIPSLASDTTAGLAPDTTDGLAPDTTDGLAPDTTPELAPDTTDGLAPDTTDGLTSGSTDGLVPDTISVQIEEKQSEMTHSTTRVLKGNITTTKMESDTRAPLLLTSSAPTPMSTSPAVPTSEHILDLTPSSPEGSSPQTPQGSALGTTDDGMSVLSATEMAHTSKDEDTEGSKVNSKPKEESSLAEISEPHGYTDPMLPSTVMENTIPPTPEHPSITAWSPAHITDRPNTGGVHPLPTTSNTAPSKNKLDEDVSMLVDKDQPKDSPVQETPKSPLSPKEEAKKKKNQKNLNSDPRVAQKVIKEKEKHKQTSKFNKKDQLSPKYFSKGIKWGFKSVYSEQSYFGKQVYRPPFVQAYRPPCPYPCVSPLWKFPLYRTNDVLPRGEDNHKEPGATKPCKRFGYNRGIYSLYLPPKNMEENLTRPKWEGRR